jgi:LysR family transcriptional regulator (chromosome initiation inhibitor)
MRFDSHQLTAFAAVIREGSFERASRALHVTPSAVSQRIKQLEQLVGQVLVVRRTPCVPTRAGEVLYRHALQVGLLESEVVAGMLESDADRTAAAATIAVAVNADSLATWVVPALARFAEHTGHRVEVVVDDEDHTAEWLRSGRVVGAVTSDAQPVQGCSAEPLGVMRYRASATPAFVQRWFGDGVTADALRRAPVLFYSRKDELQARFVRRTLGLRGVTLTPHWVPGTTAYIDATLVGLGWGMHPEALVKPLFARRQLVDLVAGALVDVPLHWQRWRLSSSTLQQLDDALRRAAATTLQAPRSRGSRPAAPPPGRHR